MSRRKRLRLKTRATRPPVSSKVVVKAMPPARNPWDHRQPPPALDADLEDEDWPALPGSFPQPRSGPRVVTFERSRPQPPEVPYGYQPSQSPSHSSSSFLRLTPEPSSFARVRAEIDRIRCSFSPITHISIDPIPARPSNAEAWRAEVAAGQAPTLRYLVAESDPLPHVSSSQGPMNYPDNVFGENLRLWDNRRTSDPPTPDPPSPTGSLGLHEHGRSWYWGDLYGRRG